MTGVLALSQTCRGLAKLNLSRNELQFKITDVAMLSLGERCPHLEELLLHGCEFVTDVGVSWLAGGCHGVRKLDLPVMILQRTFLD